MASMPSAASAPSCAGAPPPRVSAPCGRVGAVGRVRRTAPRRGCRLSRLSRTARRSPTARRSLRCVYGPAGTPARAHGRSGTAARRPPGSGVPAGSCPLWSRTGVGVAVALVVATVHPQQREGVLHTGPVVRLEGRPDLALFAVAVTHGARIRERPGTARSDGTPTNRTA